MVINQLTKKTMPLNINIAIVSTVKSLAKDLQAIREVLADFPEFQASVSASPAVTHAPAPRSLNPMQSPEENALRDEYRAAHPLGKGFRMTHFLKSKYQDNALRALRGWKAGEWTPARPHWSEEEETPPPGEAAEEGEEY